MSSYHLLSMSCLCHLLMLIRAPLATALSFSFNFSSSGDPCGTELRCEHDAHIGSGVVELTKNDMHGNLFSVGRASYARPVPLWDNATGEVASFSSNFTFQIRSIDETYEPLRNICNLSSDGMAFFLAHYPSRIPPNSFGWNLALFNDSNNLNATGDDRIVAVEFDTYFNPSVDHSNSHVGIDVNSINSRAYTNVTKGLVSDNAIMTAEISYNNRTGILVARLRIDDGEPYNVNTSVDMKTSLPEEVAVGFSAATGLCFELHQVLSWSFSSTLEAASSTTATTGGAPRLVPVLVPAAVAFLVLLCAVVGFLVRRRRIRKRLRQINVDDSDEEREQAEFERGVGPRRYPYHELAAATRNFAEEEKLGRGGFGNVYRGSLSDQDRPVAIKMFSAESSAQGRKAFEAEVKIISRLRHRNLVQLLGWCDSRKGLLLVYELVPESSLDRHIYGSLLTWSERYRIILGLGSALRYLHTEWDQCVLHGDIKPSNILLDSSRSTKLADFGLARLVDHGAGPRTTQVVMGTAGYIDPEFIRTRRPSTESDVYSFGVVLLEIVSGRRRRWRWSNQTKSSRCSSGFGTCTRNNSIHQAVDQRLKGDKLHNDDDCKWQQHRALVVGLWCTHPYPSVRPSVEQFMNVLQSEDVTLPILSRPSVASLGYDAPSSNVCSDVSWASRGR